MYASIVTLGGVSLWQSIPAVEAGVLLFANISMLGIFGIFELLIIALFVSGALTGVFDGEDRYSYLWEFGIYTFNTLVTAYVQIETVNGLRIWFYEKGYSWDEIKESFCDGDEECLDNVS